MRRSIPLWQVIGFACVSLGGTLLHFLYEWTGESPVAALISAVNESTWEHMKLLFVPMVLFAWVQRLLFPEQEVFWRVKTVGILCGLLLIPAIFYTANGGFGKTPDWMNISIFFVSAALAFLLEWWLFRLQMFAGKKSWVPLVVLMGITALFVYFTFSPPHLPLFRDPVTGGYGT